MQYLLIDRITDLQPGKCLTAVKAVSLTEDYLQDHFPKFPVMPGVMMLEAMYQASAWLVRVTDDFAHSMVVLSEANNVKYASFVAPGQLLTVKVELLKDDGKTTKLKTQGEVDGQVVVSARLTLERYNLDGGETERAPSDAYLVKRLRDRFQLLDATKSE